MIEVLDKELNITVLNLESQPNTYYLTYNLNSKCVIDTIQEEDNIVVNPDPKETCTAEELTVIIDRFSSYIFNLKPELNGMLLKTADNPMLESIGFKLLSKNSDYLYKENGKRINKVR